MLKRLLLVITTITVLFAFVTYQPKKVDAAAGTVVSFAAKQALKAATKSAVADTVGSLALKTVSKEVAENYVKKEGLNLVVLEGGKKAMVKTTMNQTEKVALKKEIDNVIDLKIYGNSPGWVKFLDWFIGVGAVVLVGQVLYAAVTGEMTDFISEIFNEAMRNLGWLLPAVPLGPNGEIPGDDPVRIPNDTPVSNPNHPTNPTPLPQYSKSIHYRDSTSTGTTVPNLLMRFETPIDYNGMVLSYETMHDSIYPETRFLFPNYMYMNVPSDTGWVERLPFFNNGSRTMTFYSNSQYSFKEQIPWDNAYLTLKYGNTTLINNQLKSSSDTKLEVLMPTGFELRKYNKFVYQRSFYDMETRNIISRLIIYNTVLSVPAIYLEVVKPFDGSTIIPSKKEVLSMYYRFVYNTTSSISLNPIDIKIGAHSSMDLALKPSYMPTPVINPSSIKVPMISPETGKIAWPQKTILPDGYIYNPKTQEILDPVGNPVTNPETIPELNPDPVIETTPDGEQVIDGVPTGQPAPVPVSPPSGGGGSEVTGGDPKDINWNKLKAVPAIFTKKFPFSLPWDAKRFIDGVLGGVPQAKDIVVKLDEIGGVHIGMNITLPDFFDTFFSFTRTMTLIIFDIGLIFGLYRLLGGAS